MTSLLTHPASTRHAGDYHALANCIRSLALDAVFKAGSGHLGMPLGMADIAAVLLSEFLRIDPTDPHWPDRDRLVISNGHGSLLLYSILYLIGSPEMSLEHLQRFRQLGSNTPGHPEFKCAGGVETTTGPLGQGLANAVGFAIAERNLNATFGSALVDHFTYVFVGDGCLMEGVAQEAIALAGHLALGRLIVFFDNNGVTIDGPTSLTTSENTCERFSAANWHVVEIDGHDVEAIRHAIREAQTINDRPSLISCRTTIGLGLPTVAGTARAHAYIPSSADVANAKLQMDWNNDAFEIPEELLRQWRSLASYGRQERLAWLRRLQMASLPRRTEFLRRLRGEMPADFPTVIRETKTALALRDAAIPTRQASGEVLEHLVRCVPELLGGSADLATSTNTKVDSQGVLSRHGYGCSYIHYGVREHAMAAAMNGIALHGGLIPYGGTYLAFSDYCRPAIRLAAMMRVGVIFVMTHDSIGVGENGPTHQPVEQLASLRAIPHLLVFRPADAIETAECWQHVLMNRGRPSVIALSHQALPLLRRAVVEENSVAKGGYVLVEGEGGRRLLTLIGTGSEVHIAVQARTILQAQGISTAVVSMPCWRLFDEQEPDYKRFVLGDSDARRVAVEAAVPMGWERYLGCQDAFVGMHDFGVSGKAADVYEHFGITPAAVAQASLRIVGTPDET